MAATGHIKFDAIALVTLEANIANKSLSGRAAFVDTRTGATHGFTDGGGSIWSDETKQALAALVDLMERDLARIHFQGTPEAPTKDGLQIDTSGIGEHLAEDAPPV